MKIVAALMKDHQVIDTYTFEMPTRGNLAEAAKKAFTYFRDRYPHLTTTMTITKHESSDSFESASGG